MKTRTLHLPAAALLCIGTISCNGLMDMQDKGSISVRISEGKSLSLPDTEDYILSVRSADGRTVYEGRFGDSPEELEVKKGTYTVSAVSEPFDEARFESPSFGDSKEVVVPAGGRVSASLLCTQVNCGLRLRPDRSFTDAFPDGILYIKGNGGRLMYGYGEKRTAYFKPGKATVTVSCSGNEQELLTRSLGEGEMLTLRLSASADAAEGISVQTDTARRWMSESYRWGEDGAEDEPSEAMDVMQAREEAGKTGAWVKGYIVGCAASSSRHEFDPPFSKSTNILLGLRSGTSDGRWCISVELKNKKIRESLNLQDNPELEGRPVYIKGDLVPSYYGLPGLKNVSEYRLDY